MLNTHNKHNLKGCFIFYFYYILQYIQCNNLLSTIKTVISVTIPKLEK